MLAFSSLVIVSCKKNFSSLSRFKIEEFNRFVDPARSHIVLLSNNEIYYYQDSTAGVIKLNTADVDKYNLAMSPDARRAAYTDSSDNVHLVNLTVNSNDRLVTKMKGAKKIHWTHDGRLYGVTEKGKFVFQSGSFAVPDIPVIYDTIRFTRDEFFDAIRMPDGKIIYSKHFEEKEGFNTKIGDSLVVWDNTDSTEMRFGEQNFDLPKKLQVDKEGNLIGYTGDLAYLFDTEFGFNGSVAAAAPYDRYIVAQQSLINGAYVDGSGFKLIIENSLRDTYPEYAVDDTMSFKGVGRIDDFDIQVPIEQYPQQTFSFD